MFSSDIVLKKIFYLCWWNKKKNILSRQTGGLRTASRDKSEAVMSERMEWVEKNHTHSQGSRVHLNSSLTQDTPLAICHANSNGADNWRV